MALQLLASEVGVPVLIGTALDISRFEGVAFSPDRTRASLTLDNGEGDFAFLELSHEVSNRLHNAGTMIIIAVNDSGSPLAAGRYIFDGEQSGSFQDIALSDLVNETAELLGQQLAYDLFTADDEDTASHDAPNNGKSDHG